jgi:5-oxoprolinase (ATP-hydrolysing)
MAAEKNWRFWIDRGGTFTDVVALTPDGAIHTSKLLSEDPSGTQDAALEAIARALGLPPGASMADAPIAEVRMGTTAGTNALLERQGAPTALVVSKGLGDVLRIGTQHRPDLFAQEIKLPEMLYSQVIEVSERVSAGGEVLTPLDEAAIRRDLEAAHRDGIRSVAIVFMHSYRYPDHEVRVGDIAWDVGFDQVSVSSEVSPLQKLVPRGDTSVVDAYLSPLLRDYVAAVSKGLGDGPQLRFMQSNGGLTGAQTFRGKDSVLSGPAGGVVGAALASRRAGFDRMIGFDMGGTSTDVCHYTGAYERTYEAELAGVRLRAPMIAIHTVAAGGGSVLEFDGQRLRVGPRSAGANPGPACYRRGGPLTITDANVLLGRIQPALFPAVFGPDNTKPLDADVVAKKFAVLAAQVQAATGTVLSPEALAEGFLAIAVDNMANAIKKISIQRGHDVADHVLVCFGGAGGQHACDVADSLGMTQILVPAHAGVLSALGIGMAQITAIREQTMETALGQSATGAIDVVLQGLVAKASASVQAQGIPSEQIHVALSAHLRSPGSDTALAVPFGPEETMIESFRAAHRNRFGFDPDDSPPILATLVTEATSETGDDELAGVEAAILSAEPIVDADVFVDGTSIAIPTIHRDHMDAPVPGPTLIIEAHGTNWIAPGWVAKKSGDGDLLITRSAPKASQKSSIDLDPVRLEIFNNLFMSVAEQMGQVLENTASSVNIKERLDFSCALFDADGGLVANAPHIPVHLGSMAESVAAVIADQGRRIKPGDVFVMNAPDQGGTHLPDITVIAPVFIDDTAACFVGARGHHADIGGITPGSMPPNSRTIDEEGVVLPIARLVEEEKFLEADLRRRLTGGPYPARNPDQNIADLKAQVAACKMGASKMRRLAADHGLNVVAAYMAHVQDNGEACVRNALADVSNSTFTCLLDNDDPVTVTITVDHDTRSATIDFAGTARQRSDNFNAPPAIARAAVLYVFRTLVDDDIPLNSGCLRPLKILLPKGTMVNPNHDAAVAAGNVETSQIICDALFGALGLLAGSQGTMNNLSFGDDRLQYYETLCGGAGAGPGIRGASAVHTHMTNSRLTDPEVLESRFPVVVEAFGIRRGSGGHGTFPGGDGVVRRLRFLQPMTAAILAGRRRIAPHGLNGGIPAKTGRTWIEFSGGSRRELGGSESVRVSQDDVLVIKTPGGGGFGGK